MSATVSTRQLAGIGTVLVDKSGLALYAADQETGGMTLCTGACTSFCKLPTVSGTPGGSNLAGSLATVQRPTGQGE